MRVARLPQAWVGVLGGGRTDELPQDEPFPSPLVSADVAKVSDRQG